jgi:hypothetical protein
MAVRNCWGRNAIDDSTIEQASLRRTGRATSECDLISLSEVVKNKLFI